jgi:hypothetical protein
MVVKFRNTSWPPPPQLSLPRRTALSSISNRTRSVYNRENPNGWWWVGEERRESLKESRGTSSHGDARRDEQSRNNPPRSNQNQPRDENRMGEGNEQRRGGLLPPIQREPWRPEQREGTWYRKEQEERELGARSKTYRQQENRGAGALDQ